MFYKTAIIMLSILLLVTVVPTNTSANVSVSAQTAILMEQESGRMLYGKHEHRQMRIASITKIMTAILAIESGKMEETVTVSDFASGTEGSSLYLKPGEKILLEDLVYGLMLRSGNDAGVAIAEHVGGSLEGFVYLMNEKADEIGMDNTVFSNPHGLDDHEEHYSTAYDMALLTQYAMKNDKYRDISSTETYRAPQEGEEWDRIWKNKNRLLTQLYKHSTGGKTGYTKRAKRTLVSTATKDDVDLIAVTLNAPSDWQDHMSLFNWAFENYELEDLVKEGVIKGIKDDFYRDNVSAAYTFSYPLTELEKDMVEKNITLYRPPEDEDVNEWGVPQPVGKMTVTLDNETIANVPLFYTAPDGEEGEKSFWTKLKEMFFFTIGVKSFD
ncbi:D-alanyl-D-alanine carboxypeptidase family protein [Desertibacillus haloalkaliphilus]|uniref:D-alanyl-D-alanine carboxypeptidase family protein n=1 Tax=Desertibacillus haloalkaliphilus TaxID=1328930 RepID=UPI001C272ED1|nr:D-alanyl-D-alanine carboxypeptidase family protein [Desertibacillus haloalkaliphilus]MBU8907170.1 D-alanyl-D-alanine carboxypeptidase [Desertibacillus haloalkaliphilus]